MSEESKKFITPSPENTPGTATETPLRIRIGRIRYANSLPFFHRLPENLFQHELQESEAAKGIVFDFFDDCPAVLNRALENSEIDLAPVSSLAYLNHQDDWLLLPDLAIGSRDFSGSVLLFSHVRIEHLNGEAIAVSKESLSATNLLQILFKFKYKFENHFVSGDSNPPKMLEQCKAALLIGDDALFYQPQHFVYKYDLSELWWSWTGKPFCFAVWAVRKAMVQHCLSGVAWVAETLRKNRDRNLQDIELLLKESLGIAFLDERFSKLFGYLFNLNYGLDPSMQDGLQLFYRLAYRLGVSPRPKPLEFFTVDLSL